MVVLLNAKKTSQKMMVNTEFELYKLPLFFYPKNKQTIKGNSNFVSFSFSFSILI